MKATVADPSRLDLRRLADTGQTIDGRWSGDSMTRLAQDTTEAPGEVGWSARAEWRPVAGDEPELWLHLRCESSVHLTCQGCLQATGVDLPSRLPRLPRSRLLWHRPRRSRRRPPTTRSKRWRP